MRVLSALLALLLVLTGQELAVARGQAAAAGTAVLCAGQGLILVTLDDQGQPTGAPHYCPDAVAALWAPPAQPLATPPARVLRPVAPAIPDVAVLSHPPIGAAQARAPPVPV